MLLQVIRNPASDQKLNSRVCLSITISQDYKDQLLNHSIFPIHKQSIVTIEPIGSQFTTWLGSDVQVAIPQLP